MSVRCLCREAHQHPWHLKDVPFVGRYKHRPSRIPGLLFIAHNSFPFHSLSPVLGGSPRWNRVLPSSEILRQRQLPFSIFLTFCDSPPLVLGRQSRRRTQSSSIWGSPGSLKSGSWVSSPFIRPPLCPPPNLSVRLRSDSRPPFRHPRYGLLPALLPRWFP